MLGPSRRAFVGLLVVTTVSTLLYSRSLLTRHHHSAPRQMDMVNDNQSRSFTSSTTWPICEERKRLAFAKNHKVGGDTIKKIFDRYGYVRKLNFVLPRSLVVSKLYPYKLDPENYMPPPPNQTFDMLIYHTVYERKRYREILPKDTTYLTIIREPLSHLKSTWNYYNLQKKFRIEGSGADPFMTFLRRPDKYDKICGHGRHVPYCLTQNPMSIDLGFPEENNKRVTFGCDVKEREDLAREFLWNIHADFHLVMIMEYFDESLVLLKRLMCWTLQDILYYKINARNYASKGAEIPPNLRQIHREWSYVDYVVYDHFNRTFWRRVNSAGNDFWGEVRYFKQINQQMTELCDGFKSKKPCSVSTLHVNDSQWGPGFTLDRHFCLLVKRSLRCNLLLESERSAKSLRLDRNNLTIYGEVKNRVVKKSVRSRKSRTKVSAKDVVSENCVYCMLAHCDPLDYLTHFYEDGYVDSATYRNIIGREFPSFVRQCDADL